MNMGFIFGVTGAYKDAISCYEAALEIAPKNPDAWLSLGLIEKKQGHFSSRPVAAVLPGSAEEVQAIVKACNRFKVKYRAHSTGWVWLITPMAENVVILDMRRMNRILEIDKKNMFAVVEPYVVAAQLQAEAMKVGLNCNLIGAGASCSPCPAW